MMELNVSRSREYVDIAKSCLKKLERGRRRKVNNILHYCYILKAELLAYRRKKAAEKFYLLAIEYAGRQDVTHEHAYGCERLALYYTKLRNDHNEAYVHARSAYDLYSKWGSRRKCQQLKEKFPKLDESPEAAAVERTA